MTEPISHLLYLHGFRSSPQSTKARKVAAWVGADTMCWILGTVFIVTKDQPKVAADDEKDSTDKGYDDAAHGGGSRFGVAEGDGGVFGTTGGGTYGGGMQVIDPAGDETVKQDRDTPAPQKKPLDRKPG